MIRILVVANSSILGEVIETLLAWETGLCVRRMTPLFEDDVKQAIDEFLPAVIITEEDLFGKYLTGVDNFSDDLGALRIITISSEQNQIEVNDRYRIPMAGLEDLIAQVKSVNRED